MYCYNWDHMQARAREVCPHCHARFTTVEELVTHVAAHHQAGSSRPQGTARPTRNEDQCPHCGERISDPVALVRHVQSHEYAQHTRNRGTPRPSHSECVIS